MAQRYVEDAALSGNPVLISGNNVQYQRFAKLYLSSLVIITDIKHNFTHPWVGLLNNFATEKIPNQS